MRRVPFFTFLSVFLLALILLVSGSSLLLFSVKGIPFGNIITWAGIVALPLTVYFGIEVLRNPDVLFYKLLSRLLKVMIVLSFLWGLVSYLLSGNLSFTFSNKPGFQGGQTAMEIFWIYSYGVVSGTLILLIVYWVSLIFYRKNNLQH